MAANCGDHLLPPRHLLFHTQMSLTGRIAYGFVLHAQRPIETLKRECFVRFVKSVKFFFFVTISRRGPHHSTHYRSTNRAPLGRVLISVAMHAQRSLSLLL